MPRPPHFFIVGAPKCGTTSLYHYLREHPHLYLPARKEPHYYADDLTDLHNVHDADAYHALFTWATADSVCGEASTWYLFSKVAVPRIVADNPEAMLVACVRNPVEMAPSLYNQLAFMLREDAPTFEQAWELQEPRALGEGLPVGAKSPQLFQYGEVCKLGQQLERLLGHVPRRQVKVIFLEDLQSKPREVYQDVLAFLGVPGDGREEFRRYNERKQLRSARLARLIRQPPGPLATVKRGAKRMLELIVDRPGEKVQGLYARRMPRQPLHDSTRAVLRRWFAHDIKLLSSITGRDLSCWLE